MERVAGEECGTAKRSCNSTTIDRMGEGVEGAPRSTSSNHSHGSGFRNLPERSRTLSQDHKERDYTGSSNPINSTNYSAPSAFRPGSLSASRSDEGHPPNSSPNSYTSTHSNPIVNMRSNTISVPPTQTLCAACGSVVAGQFVRALGGVYHRSCFICNVTILCS